MLNAQAQEIANNAGLLTDRMTVNRKMATPRIIDIYHAHHVVGEGDDLATKGASSELMCHELFGGADDDGQLRNVVSALTALDGPVQKALNGNGELLCMERLNVHVIENGVAITRSTKVRFLTASPEVARVHLFRPVRESIMKFAERKVSFLDLMVKRMPALLPERKQLLLDLGDDLRGKAEGGANG